MGAASAIGRAIWAGVDPDGMFRRHAADTEPFTVQFPGLGTVRFFATEDGARDILTAPSTLCRAPLPNPIEPVVGENSLILMSGEPHRQARSLLAPPFRAELMRGYVGLIAHATDLAIAGLKAGDQLRAGQVAQAITLDVVIRVVFGVTDSARRERYAEVTSELLSSGSAPLMLVPLLRRGSRGPWARLVRARDELDRLLAEEIAERRAGGEHRGDVLDLILGATDEHGNTLSDEALYGQLRTMLAAGHETTSTTLAWALHHIYSDEDVRDRLVREVSTAATPTDLAALPYLAAVIQETLRMHPAVPIVLRRLTGPLTVAGQPCSAGDIVGIALPALHFNPALWQDPATFNPSRFLDGKPSPFQYAPFGGGFRRCIGAAFAQSELAVAIGTIVRTLDLRMAQHHRRPPRAVPRGIATRPSREIVLDVLARR
ncbi:cytochrome P450 [Mycobacterium sp. M26]|uniref:cytochrome P450 n=1 Tax=Mycobacterium sp. M26 TaxID=1762962 RepID=UPI00073E3DA7|nr:cytochrome P450 [Mycobacterium sp. M26]